MLEIHTMDMTINIVNKDYLLDFVYKLGIFFIIYYFDVDK